MAEHADGRRDIVQAGDPVLRRGAAPLTREELRSREIRELVEVMVATMRAAPGVGLAAPQIGVGRRLIVVEDREELMARVTPEDRASRSRVPFPLTVVANPVLRLRGEPTRTFFEGCLSVAGYMAMVDRHHEVEVEGLDADGDPLRLVVEGWPARIFQHEVDHVNGTLYVDRMRPRTLCANAEVLRWLNLPVAEVLRELEGR